jgi:two-component system, OmpR family, sensor kinase
MSLRARLLLGATLIALVLAVAAVAVVRTTRANLIDQVDAQLGSANEQVRGSLGPGAPQRPQDDVTGAPPALSPFYIGWLSAAGELTALRTPNLHGDDAPLPEVDAGDVAALEAGATITVASSDPDVDYRMRAQRQGPRGLTVVVALPLDDVRQSVGQLVFVVVIAGLAVLAVLGLVIWWVVHLGVRPVRRMTATASAIAAGDLSQRVAEGTPGTEAGDLGVALNGMLGRIEDAFDERAASEARLRRFVADASHELRTPVATIRGYAELYRAGALEAPSELDDAMRRTEEEALRMGTLVDDLLHLARLDQGRPLERGPVDLGRLVEDSVRDARAVDPDREIVASVAEPVIVLGDGARLHQVLANLLANARVHAPGAPIEVRVHEDGAHAVIEVRDEGPGMSEADAARAFERFYRADASRSRHHGGSGLGLAIVDATVRAHGGATTITSSPGDGTTVQVRLPLRPAPLPQPEAVNR